MNPEFKSSTGVRGQRRERKGGRGVGEERGEEKGGEERGGEKRRMVFHSTVTTQLLLSHGFRHRW